MGNIDVPIILITREKSRYGGLILEHVLKNGLNIKSVIIQRWGRDQKILRLRSYIRKYGLVTVLFSKGIEWLDTRLVKIPDMYKGKNIEEVINSFDIPYKIVDKLNGPETFNTITEYSPDIILLGGVGILSEKIIRCARQGVINAHPGKVPEYRGSYVIRWAILKGDNVNITTHFVDTGVDTGKVLESTSITLPKTNSIIKIETIVDYLRAGFLVENAKKLILGEIVPQKQVEEVLKNIYSIMPPIPLLKLYFKLFLTKKI